METKLDKKKRSGRKETKQESIETKWDELERKKIMWNDVEQKETMWDERKMIDLLLFAGIEPTGTIFQTINNLLLIGNFTTSVQTSQVMFL